MTHVCLMHHTKLDQWMQLGGHCDGDFNILNVAIKEAQEESGIKNIRPLKHDIFDIDLHLIPANYHEAAHYHFDVRFLLHAYDNNTLIKNHESKELKWVEKKDKEIPQNVVKMFAKWEQL
jgi:8-oxo-dGTP pyrophosphatase MutT (NUDIX family)